MQLLPGRVGCGALCLLFQKWIIVRMVLGSEPPFQDGEEEEKWVPGKEIWAEYPGQIAMKCVVPNTPLPLSSSRPGTVKTLKQPPSPAVHPYLLSATCMPGAHATDAALNVLDAAFVAWPTLSPLETMLSGCLLRTGTDVNLMKF